MVHKVLGGWACRACRSVHATEADAEACATRDVEERSAKLAKLYVAFETKDLDDERVWRQFSRRFREIKGWEPRSKEDLDGT